MTIRPPDECFPRKESPARERIADRHDDAGPASASTGGRGLAMLATPPGMPRARRITEAGPKHFKLAPPAPRQRQVQRPRPTIPPERDSSHEVLAAAKGVIRQRTVAVQPLIGSGTQL